MKSVHWIGTSKEDLKQMPDSVQDKIGHDLLLVQLGREPRDWKPMTSIGPGVREIRVKDAAGAFRTVYVATIGEQVHVLHCFQKKTQKNSKQDLDLATQRFKDLVRSLR